MRWRPPRAPEPLTEALRARASTTSNNALLVGCPQLLPPPDVTDDNLATAQRNFPTSFHGDRHGKATFYSAPDGFSQLTGIPIEQLACVKCHSPTYTDGTTVDAATYTASCRDCHVDPDKPADNPVTDQICDVRAAGEAVRDLPVAAAARLHSQASGPAASHVGVRRCVSRRAGDRALLAASTRALRGLGFRELVRTFLVGNAEATLWHWRCGFRPAW